MIKGNLIRDVRVISVFFVLLLNVFSCKAQKTFMNDSQVIYNIIFGDGFNNDMVNLSIDDVNIFEDVYLISDKSDGVTTKWVHISQDNKYIYVSSSENNELKRIGLVSDKIKLKVDYKGKAKEFDVKKENGIYIVISDDGIGNLIFNQSVDKPIFD